MLYHVEIRGYNKSLLNDCLAKTQVPANPFRGYIGAEACPVLVSQPFWVIQFIWLARGVSSSERQL